MQVNDAAVADLAPATLYEILALRSAVFVVEQRCLYLDPDGRDLEPGARQLWVVDDAHVVATLRTLDDTGDGDGALRIGRVATRHDARGSGAAGALMRHAIEMAGAREIVLDAQTYLEQWYTRFGFVRVGEDFLDDGIWHVTMRRAPSGGPAPT